MNNQILHSEQQYQATYRFRDDPYFEPASEWQCMERGTLSEAAKQFLASLPQRDGFVNIGVTEMGDDSFCSPQTHRIVPIWTPIGLGDA